MKKNKDVSDEDEYSADDPDELETASGEEEAESSVKKRPTRSMAKKRQFSEAEEDEDEDDEDDDEDLDEEEADESDSDSAKKPKKTRRSKKDEEEDDDSDDNNFHDTSGPPPKDYTSGAFVVAKTDIVCAKTNPFLWRIDGKALLQKYVPFQENGVWLYKSTSTYSGWSINNKDKYLPAQVTFKNQGRNETVVEFHIDQLQQIDTKEEKED